MRSKVRQNKFGENGYCRNYFIKKTFCHTFPVIPKAQNYGDKRRNIIAISKNGYQVASSSQLFAWFMKAKIYKVESCTIYFALNFPLCCPDYP